MAITIDFAKEYEHLICKDIPKLQLQSYPNQPKIPEKYRKQFVHPENGFVKMFWLIPLGIVCKAYSTCITYQN